MFPIPPHKTSPPGTPNPHFLRLGGKKSGPRGAYGRFAIQYDKLGRAIKLCTKAGLGLEPALKSASWGVGQVMGFNHKVAGHSTAQKMVEAMVQTEDAQLAGMVNFMVGNDLAGPLKNQDWAAFARKYNGKDFAQHKYDVNLEQQYARFSTGSMPNIELRTAQAALLLLGYGVGKIDGIIGNRTRTGLQGFQITAGLPVTGELDSTTY